IEKLGKWPFPRNYHALMVEALDAAGADTIIFDIFFSESKEGDEGFAAAIAEAGNVYMPYVFELDFMNSDKTRVYAKEYAASLLEMFSEPAEGTGYINVVPDMDGKVRRVPPVIEYEEEFYPHLTVLAAINDLGYDFKDVKIVPGKKMIVGKKFTIPLDEISSMIVDYPDAWGKAFRHYSYVDILQSYLSNATGQEPLIDLGEFEDAVCFIGLTATASPDAHPSPLERLYPGVGVHTSIYDSIIKNTFLIRSNKWWNLFILIVMWILTAYVTEKSRKRFALISLFLIMGGYIFIAFLLFWLAGIWIDVFYPVITMTGVYIIFTFKKYVTESQKRELMEKELDIAKDIQRSFLPKEIPDAGGIDVNVKMITAKRVGGDLYDIVQLDDKRLGIMIGDVSGKGFPAALYMAEAVSIFRAFAQEGTVSDVLSKMNNRLVKESDSGLFVTLTYMIFDIEHAKTSFAIGGHMPTMLIDPDGDVDLLNVEEGIPLGMIEGEFSRKERDYKPGSIFVLYSDGVTEAMNTKGEMFGQERLSELGRSLKGATAKEAVDAVHKAVFNFAGRADQYDDITVMAVKV
ncbi:MAG: SpoIIE family protein phosphatase, partial [Candidatus Omnitrophica bacterium]|nr:SpoIIE family protein phosphatase [Candidatus Omnitrophota bacterium]